MLVSKPFFLAKFVLKSILQLLNPRNDSFILLFFIGTRDNFLAKARRIVVGEMESVLKSYTGEEDETVADLIGNVIDDILGDSGFGILSGNVNVTYYEHVDNTTKASSSFDENADYKSLMWTIPFGKDPFLEVVCIFLATFLL